jgi:holin-like protein
MLGMVLLFVLLCLGAVRLEWIEAGASLLLSHLAFFFVPIAVGLMDLGDVWRSSGLALLFILVASAAAGILFAGLVTHLLAVRQRTDLRRSARTSADGVAP